MNATFSFLQWRHAIRDSMPSMRDHLGSYLLAAYNYAVVHPMNRLYRHGPAIRGVGFWRSSESQDICSALTGVQAEFWRHNLYECDRLIERDVMSYVVFIETIAYFWILWHVFRLALLAVRAAFRSTGPVVTRLTAYTSGPSMEHCGQQVRKIVQRYSPILLTLVRRRSCNQRNGAGKVHVGERQTPPLAETLNGHLEGLHSMKAEMVAGALRDNENDSPYKIYVSSSSLPAKTVSAKESDRAH